MSDSEPLTAHARDLRCVKCGKLILRYIAQEDGARVDVKCGRCGTLQERVLSRSPSCAAPLGANVNPQEDG